ncbi:hypothetical protein O6H91_07G027000 [Diphasiastrum complanatum]|uniref:Uncharacterized protein n=1 Tax=Diphasiastrum complanatum TaxID=34168 RepID=A0ACC2D3E3_DIPCM|nr:hypothetical protein O6H91_07G027000 [Diphasiastrum complanatum]
MPAFSPSSIFAFPFLSGASSLRHPAILFVQGFVHLDSMKGSVSSRLSSKHGRVLKDEDANSASDSTDDDDEDYSISMDYQSSDTGEDDTADEKAEDDANHKTRVPCWHCKNCTARNICSKILCGVCREHRESGILLQGHRAPSHLPAKFLEQVQNLKEELSCQDGRIKLTATPTLASVGCISECESCTLVGYDERMLLHFQIQGHSIDDRPVHPERPNRLEALLSGLFADGLLPGRCEKIVAREATHDELEMVHTKGHIEFVEAPIDDANGYTFDTYKNNHSALAAKVAAGICAELALSIIRHKARNGFALVRPPGHHAEAFGVKGFCYYNNAAVAARVAQKAGAKKVLIVDWDVHHGNGTQDIFNSDPSVLYISLHRYDASYFYPQSGSVHEVGFGFGEGFSVNIPWNFSGVGDGDYINAFLHIVLPIARQFSPDLTIISAGFDAAIDDPLGLCKVTPAGFAHMTHLLTSLSKGRVLVVLEGGYNLRSVSASAAAVLKVLLGENPGSLPENVRPTQAGKKAIRDVIAVQSRYWTALKTKLARTQTKERDLKKGVAVHGPIWFKWGRRKLVYAHWCKVLYPRYHSPW